MANSTVPAGIEASTKQEMLKSCWSFTSKRYSFLPVFNIKPTKRFPKISLSDNEGIIFLIKRISILLFFLKDEY